ncbi:MaoC/PaaZ C-terminal domain-containing protein [Chloroflexota bacterium]
MTAELYFEDVEVGTEIGPMIKHPDLRHLVMWAGASGDFNPLHYSNEFAQSKGFPGIIVHGQLAACFLGQLMTDWKGGNGVLKKLTCRYRGVNFPNEDLICQGEVINKYIDHAEHYVECNIWIEQRQEKTVTGTALITLPSRG